MTNAAPFSASPGLPTLLRGMAPTGTQPVPPQPPPQMQTPTPMPAQGVPQTPGVPPPTAPGGMNAPLPQLNAMATGQTTQPMGQAQAQQSAPLLSALLRQTQGNIS